MYNIKLNIERFLEQRTIELNILDYKSIEYEDETLSDLEQQIIGRS